MPTFPKKWLLILIALAVVVPLFRAGNELVAAVDHRHARQAADRERPAMARSDRQRELGGGEANAGAEHALPLGEVEPAPADMARRGFAARHG